MNAIRKAGEILSTPFESCHEGTGVLMCRSLLDSLESRKFPYIHRDFMAAGVSIGNHPHTVNEEIYYLLIGKGTLTFDGAVYEMAPGDISLCGLGHSHGFLATEDSELMVIASEVFA